LNQISAEIGRVDKDPTFRVVGSSFLYVAKQLVPVPPSNVFSPQQNTLTATWRSAYALYFYDLVTCKPLTLDFIDH
jgi:hypothetical protein